MGRRVSAPNILVEILPNPDFSDLRHMLEKRKCRKLSKEEKVLFKEKAVVFVGKMVVSPENSI